MGDLRRVTLLFGVSILVAIALFIWIFWARQSSPEPGPEAVVIRRPIPASRPSPTPAQPVVTDTDEVPRAGESASEIHTLAFPWRSQIQCPTDLPDGPYAFAALVPFDPNAVQIRVGDGVLTASVDHAYGGGSLRRGFGTVANMTWSGAADGQVGTCSVAEATPLAVRGYVDGGGIYTIVGCEPGQMTESGADGSFMLEIPEGRTCRIRAILAEDGRTAVGPVEVIEVQGAIPEVVLFPPDTDVVPEESLEAIATQLRAVMDAQEAVPTRLERSLQNDEIDADTRAKLEQWVADEADQRKEALDMLERALESEDPQAALLEVLQIL